MAGGWERECSEAGLGWQHKERHLAVAGPGADGALLEPIVRTQH